MKRAKTVLRTNNKAAVAASLALLATYAATQWPVSGAITYILTLLPAAAVGVTALARVNDLSEDHKELRWQVRRVGLILTGVAAFAFVGSVFSAPLEAISWKAVLLMWGLALTWFTTPGMPPWWKYITGESKESRGGGL